MIISASYKTDIPTFYGEWFGNRLDAGYCKMVNPYNRKAYRVSLELEDVDGFVFWTKNAGPFLGKLAVISERGYPFIVQYTINGYPRALEFSVVDSERSVEHMRVIAETYGTDVGVWRYDPILVSSDTPIDFHRRNFSSLCPLPRRIHGRSCSVLCSGIPGRHSEIWTGPPTNLDSLGKTPKTNPSSNWLRNWLPLRWPTVSGCACAPKTNTWRKG